jgi:heme/copper-type cytochrome/quinol oxidase subunit 2
MTGVAFVLYTNYMVTDPGTTPSKGKAQFMFGSAVAFVYAALMLDNIVYTLFYATAIVCGVRGLGWWAAHFYQKSKQRRTDAEMAAGQGRLTGAGASA